MKTMRRNWDNELSDGFFSEPNHIFNDLTPVSTKRAVRMDKKNDEVAFSVLHANLNTTRSPLAGSLPKWDSRPGDTRHGELRYRDPLTNLTRVDPIGGE